MRILVTGTKGQLACALTRAAEVRPGPTVIAMGRPELDLQDAPSKLAYVIGKASPDLIVNAAAFTKVDEAETSRDLAFAINRDGAGKIAAVAAGLGVPIIQISTDYVFAGDLDRPYVETDLTGPLNIYGHSKLAGEKAVRTATPNHVILRTSWVYGADGNNFLKTMLRLASKPRTVRVVDDQRGCPTYAGDLANGIIEIAEWLLKHPGQDSLRGTFHMSSSGETSWAGFAEAIFEANEARGGPPMTVEPISSLDYGAAARRPGNSRLNCDKLLQNFLLRPGPWRTGMAHCLEAITTLENEQQDKASRLEGGPA